METTIARKTLQAGATTKRGVIILSIIYLLCSLLIGFIILVSTTLDIPYEHFTADPAAIYNAHPFLGLASNIGVLMWCAAAAICLFTWAVSEHRNRDSLFLLWSGLITAILLLDDFFMFHEAIFPWYLGLSEEGTYAIYATLVLWYLIWFRYQILDTEYMLLLVAFIFLGLSVVGDFILPQYGVAYLIEDGFKLFGIATWLFYYTRVCYQHLKHRTAAQ